MSTAGLFTSAGFLVDRRPRAALGLLCRDTATLVTVGDVLGLSLLLAGLLRFIALRHRDRSSLLLVVVKKLYELPYHCKANADGEHRPLETAL